MEFEVDESSKQCTFVADIGYICPLKFTMGDICINAFMDCSVTVQKLVAKALSDEWGLALKIDTVHNAMQLIQSHWSSSDLMYVMTSGDNVMGFVAVDRKSFYPCISHLFVMPDHRGNGYSGMLLAIAETYIAHMHFTEARLWCKPDLVEFYKKHGYTEEDKLDDANTLMLKLLT